MTFEEWLQSGGLKLFKSWTYKGHFETGLKEAIEAVWIAAYEQGYQDNIEMKQARLEDQS